MTQEDRAEQARGLAAVVLDHLAVERLVDANSDSSIRQRSSLRSRPIVAAFLGVDPEPDTGPLLGGMHRAGFDVVVPVCEPGRVLSWTRWEPGAPLVRSALAPVDEPTGPRCSFDRFSDVRLVLVPALGVDRSGHRIGQGGGYYDRFLASTADRSPALAPAALALVYRTEVLAAGAVPADAHDHPIAGVFTADGLVRTP